MNTTVIKPQSDAFSRRQASINKKLEAVIAANVETRDIFAERRVRHGKTHRDYSNGNRKRNYEAKMARGAWCADSRASAESFPSHTCNGKRTRALRGQK